MSTSSSLSPEDIALWDRYIRSAETVVVVKQGISQATHLIKQKLDLHGMTVQQAFNSTKAFIQSHHEAGNKQIVIVCGKGGQIADELTHWCMNTGLVRSCDPILDSMGEVGAYKIMLRRSTAMR